MDYDFQILLDQFDDLKNIPLLFKKEEFKQLMNQKVKCFIGSFIGFPNSGKTFLFNQVQRFGYTREVNLPSGYHVSTRGISGLVNIIKDGSYHLWFDSEGMQKAVLIDKDKFQWQGDVEDEKSKYKYQEIVNEEFQKNDIFEKIQIQLLLRISNPVIFVIDSLSELEQKYIFQLYQSYVEGNNQKQTIIIFNNKSVQNQEELNKNLEILQSTFPLQKLKKDNIEYYQDQRFPSIKFLILVDQDSALGQKINPFVYKIIAEIAGQKFLFQNVLNTIKEYFNDNIWRYVNFSFKEKKDQEVDYQNIYVISNNQDNISLAYELKSEIKPKILSISPLGQNQDVIQYVILFNEQNDYLLFQVKIFLPGDIQFIKYDVFLEKQTKHQYLSIKYKQQKDQYYQELEAEKQTYLFPPSESLQFDVQHEFDILITQKVGTAMLVENQPNQNESELENGIYTFEIQFFPDE
ncbi:hypothetical protein ABPG72_014545 [Tetrahymena utriculariae]